MICRPSCHRAIPRPLLAPSDSIWISEDTLSQAYDRFISGSKTTKRYGSSVPGPLESRRRLGRRRMGLAHHATPPLIPSFGSLWSLISEVDFTRWRWEAPRTRDKTKDETVIKYNISTPYGTSIGISEWWSSLLNEGGRIASQEALSESKVMDHVGIQDAVRPATVDQATNTDLFSSQTIESLVQVICNGIPEEIEKACAEFNETIRSGLILGTVSAPLLTDAIIQIPRNLRTGVVKLDLAYALCHELLLNIWDGIVRCELFGVHDWDPSIFNTILRAISRLPRTDETKGFAGEVFTTAISLDPRWEKNVMWDKSLERFETVKIGLSHILRTWLKVWTIYFNYRVRQLSGNRDVKYLKYVWDLERQEKENDDVDDQYLNYQSLEKQTGNMDVPDMKYQPLDIKSDDIRLADFQSQSLEIEAGAVDVQKLSGPPKIDTVYVDFQTPGTYNQDRDDRTFYIKNCDFSQQTSILVTSFVSLFEQLPRLMLPTVIDWTTGFILHRALPDILQGRLIHCWLSALAQLPKVTDDVFIRVWRRMNGYRHVDLDEAKEIVFQYRWSKMVGPLRESIDLSTEQKPSTLFCASIKPRGITCHWRLPEVTALLEVAKKLDKDHLSLIPRTSSIKMTQNRPRKRQKLTNEIARKLWENGIFAIVRVPMPSKTSKVTKRFSQDPKHQDSSKKTRYHKVMATGLSPEVFDPQILELVKNDPIPPENIWNMVFAELGDLKKLQSGYLLSASKIALLNKMAIAFTESTNRPPRVILREVTRCLHILAKHQVPLSPEIGRAIVNSGLNLKVDAGKGVPLSRLKWVLDKVERIEGYDAAVSVHESIETWNTLCNVKSRKTILHGGVRHR